MLVPGAPEITGTSAVLVLPLTVMWNSGRLALPVEFVAGELEGGADGVAHAAVDAGPQHRFGAGAGEGVGQRPGDLGPHQSAP